MNFPFCKVVSSKADFGNGRIRIAFEMNYTDENKELAERLAAYIGKDTPAVEVRIIPVQPLLFVQTPRKQETDPEQVGNAAPTQPGDWKAHEDGV